MAYARNFSGLSMAVGRPQGARPARPQAATTRPRPVSHQCGTGALGLICPSGGPGETRIRETWASSRSRPRCTDVSGFEPLDGSESLLTEAVSAAILRASPERATLEPKLVNSRHLVFVAWVISYVSSMS